MKELAFRFTAMSGAPILTSWRDIKYFPGVTVGDGDAIEYAYAAPVVTEEMAARGEAARVKYMENVAADRINSMKAAITAALETPDAD